MSRRLPLDHIQLLSRYFPILYRVFTPPVYPIARANWVEELHATFGPGGGEDEIGENVVGYDEGSGIVRGLGTRCGINTEAEGCEDLCPASEG